MFNSSIPVCCFLSLLSPLFLISSCQEREEWQASPRTEIIEMGCLHRISFISLPIWWRYYLWPSFDMDCLLALWPLLLLVSLVTCKAWSSDLYLKKPPCNMVYILTQNSIKHPCSTRDLGPHVHLSLSLSLSLSFWLIPWSAKVGCITQGILASFLLSLSYHRLRTTRFWSIKGPQHGLPFPSPMRESEKWKWSRSVVSDSSRPHGLQPTRLLHPWDFPGKSTGVGCHCLLCDPIWSNKKKQSKTQRAEIIALCALDAICFKTAL